MNKLKKDIIAENKALIQKITDLENKVFWLKDEYETLETEAAPLQDYIDFIDILQRKVTEISYKYAVNNKLPDDVTAVLDIIKNAQLDTEKDTSEKELQHLPFIL